MWLLDTRSSKHMEQLPWHKRVILLTCHFSGEHYLHSKAFYPKIKMPVSWVKNPHFLCLPHFLCQPFIHSLISQGLFSSFMTFKVALKFFCPLMGLNLFWQSLCKEGEGRAERQQGINVYKPLQFLICVRNTHLVHLQHLWHPSVLK